MNIFMWSAYVINNSNPNIPERQCFNNSAYLNGKELFRLLCLEPEHNHGSHGYSKPKTYSSCVYEMKRKKTYFPMWCESVVIKTFQFSF